MNETFNVTRFALLFKKTIAERPAQLIGLVGLVLVIVFALFTLFVQNNQWGAAHNLSFIWGYIGGGVLLASVVFGQFGTNAGGASYLTLPASIFEKWLCGVLIVGVIFTAAFLSFYRLMDYAFVTIYHNNLDKTSPTYQQMYDMAYVFDFNSRVPVMAYAIFFNFAGAMMIGSLYYNKAGLIKNALTMAGIIFFIYILNSVVVNALFTHVAESVPFNTVFIKTGADNKALSVPKSVADGINIIWFYILPAILWITAYIRLKEKEI